MKHGKKYAEAAKAIDRSNLYDPAEAISLAKKAANTRRTITTSPVTTVV